MLRGPYLPENLCFPAFASDLLANVFYKTRCLAYTKEIHLTWYKQKDVLTVIAGKKEKKKNSFTNKLNPLLFNK